MAAQSPDGQLLLTVRIQNQGIKRKLMALSTTGGASWDSTWLASDLPTPMCQSSICYIQGPERGAFYQVGPADTATRSQLTLWSSEHGGKLWQKEAVIYEGSSAYSDIVSLGDIELGFSLNETTTARLFFSGLPYRKDPKKNPAGPTGGVLISSTLATGRSPSALAHQLIAQCARSRCLCAKRCSTQRSTSQA